MRLRGSTDLSRIAIIKRTGGALGESHLDSGFLLEKRVGVGQPRRVENAKILIANTVRTIVPFWCSPFILTCLFRQWTRTA